MLVRPSTSKRKKHFWIKFRISELSSGNALTTFKFYVIYMSGQFFLKGATKLTYHVLKMHQKLQKHDIRRCFFVTIVWYYFFIFIHEEIRFYCLVVKITCLSCFSLHKYENRCLVYCNHKIWIVMSFVTVFYAIRVHVRKDARECQTRNSSK